MKWVIVKSSNELERISIMEAYIVEYTLSLVEIKRTLCQYNCGVVYVRSRRVQIKKFTRYKFGIFRLAF